MRRGVGEGGLFTYELPDTELPHGSSLGNAHGFVTSKGTGAMEGLFSTDLGRRVTGALVLNYFAEYTDLSRLAVEEEHPAGSGTLVRLEPAGPGRFRLHPAYQRHLFTLVGGFDVEETLFLPRTNGEDPCLAYQMARVTNHSARPTVVAVVACIHLPGDMVPDIVAEYRPGMSGFTAWNRSHPEWARVFACPQGVDAHLATTDQERAWRPSRPLPDRVDGEGDLSAALQAVRFLRPGESAELAFVVVFSPGGREDAERLYHRARDARQSLERTIGRYRDEVAAAEVRTPDRLVNEGAQWAKANMLRVLARYPTGIAFTNEPGVSSNVVARDAAWFVYGCDFLSPDDCCRMLALLAETQQPEGKIVEYYDARTLCTDDYGLNVNDATPLFLMAAGHHLRATAHRHCTERLYPAMVRAAEYLLSQRDERGLVFCTARGTGERGICGWRNVMPNVTISGAVTEINSETYAGLRALAEAAASLGHRADAGRFAAAAEDLRAAMEAHLKNPENGLYYLNIDVEGRPRSEVTADLVFPLICGAADPETTRLISDRLNHPDFMTEAGLRTVSRLDPLYTPDRLVGLQGGVWPGVTWWYAISCMHSDPGLMIEALRGSYRQYIRDPGRYNTVPGQFSEWFDGEALQNRGMRLSPWEPPRFLWALLEGAMGVRPRHDGLSLDPRLPVGWKWARVRDLPYQGRQVSWFLARFAEGLRFFTADEFETDHPVERFDEEISDSLCALSEDVAVTALGRSDEVLIAIGSAAETKQPSPLLVRRLVDNARRYEVQFYSSEVGRWEGLGAYRGGGLERLSADVEGGGFVLFRLRPCA
ncbi:MAG: hypothetical protein HY321_04820 [Armatimonadetes bacterium]|nr:hypothetical protein [Armatimonadota bacterium]